MQLNEVIEENSIETIAKRTRISVENIERLVNRDFSMMKRVKAQGFISILEREFNIELDSLKSECRDYFSSHPSELFDASLVISAVPEDRGTRGGLISKILMLLVLFVVAYGAWSFFSNKGQQFVDVNVTTQSGDSSFIGKIVSQAQEWLGNSSTIVHSEESSPSVNGVWAEKDADSNDTNNTDSNIEEKSNPIKLSDAEANDSINEERIIREAKEEQQEIIAQEEADDNSADPFSIESIMGKDIIELSDKNESIDDSLGEATPSGTLATEVPSITEETNIDEAVAVVAETVSKVVVFHPLKKVWIGYTNLDTMKRETKVTEDDIEFDTAVGKWILVAGHGSIAFQINGEDIELEKKDKNYFLIKNGKVQSIEKEEFQKLNKSKVW